jgi:hypothetical protein
MRAVNFTELAAQSGELLPERTVLGTVTPITVPFNNEQAGTGTNGDGGAGSASSSAAAAGGGDGGTVIYNPVVATPAGDHGQSVTSACQSSTSAGTGGLLGTGIGAQPGTTVQSCAPAASTGSY